MGTFITSALMNELDVRSRCGAIDAPFEGSHIFLGNVGDDCSDVPPPRFTGTNDLAGALDRKRQISPIRCCEQTVAFIEIPILVIYVMEIQDPPQCLIEPLFVSVIDVLNVCGKR